MKTRMRTAAVRLAVGWLAAVLLLTACQAGPGESQAGSDAPGTAPAVTEPATLPGSDPAAPQEESPTKESETQMAQEQGYNYIEELELSAQAKSAVRDVILPSIQYGGSKEIRGAIAAVLHRAQAGEKVTVVFLGDSHTAGAGATSPRFYWTTYATKYLEALDGDPDNGNVDAYNAGIGSTEDVYNGSRIQKDVLSHQPDLVIHECDANNIGQPYAKEAYEGAVSKILRAGVPVIDYAITRYNGSNMLAQKLEVNQFYGIPTLSFVDTLLPLIQTGTVEGLTAAEFYSADMVHLSNSGHPVAACILDGFLETLLEEADGALTTDYKSLSLTPNGYADSIFVENFDASELGVSVEMNGWTADYAARIFTMSTEGWQASQAGASITFRFTAGYFGILMTMAARAGDIEYQIDGGPVKAYREAGNGNGYMYVNNLLHDYEAGEHTITIMTAESSRGKSWFGICGVIVGNFDGVEPPEGEKPGQIDPITADSLYLGTINTYETEGGPKAGAGWLRSELTGQGDIVFFKTMPDKNLSAYAEGYLHIWVYVDSLAKMRAYPGMVEISSARTVDEEEMYWDLSAYLKTDGWNELWLPLADSKAQGKRPIDLSVVNCIRVVGMAGPSGLVMGIDDIYLSAEKP